MKHRFTIELDLPPELEAALCEAHDQPDEWGVVEFVAGLHLAVPLGQVAIVDYERVLSPEEAAFEAGQAARTRWKPGHEPDEFAGLSGDADLIAAAELTTRDVEGKP